MSQAKTDNAKNYLWKKKSMELGVLMCLNKESLCLDWGGLKIMPLNHFMVSKYFIKLYLSYYNTETHYIW